MFSSGASKPGWTGGSGTIRLRKGGALRRAWDRHLEFGELDQGVMAKVAIVVGVPARQLLRMARWVRRTGRTLARGKNDLDTEQG